MARTPNYLVTAPTLPVNSVRELVAYARANKGKLHYGSTNVTGVIGGAMLSLKAELGLTHVPYKGASQALIDLVGGRIDVMFDLVKRLICFRCPGEF